MAGSASATPPRGGAWGTPCGDDLVLNNCSTQGFSTLERGRKHVAWLPALVEKSPAQLSIPGAPRVPPRRGVLRSPNSSKVARDMRVLSEDHAQSKHGSDAGLGRDIVKLMKETVRNAES